MAHEVFICYASRDQAVAEAVCNALEARLVQCWIAPRDVLPGTEWAEAIVDALDESRVLVLVLSSSSNTSPQVIREVGRAASQGIPIIPIRIDDVAPSKALDFFVSSHHWLDAQKEPLQNHLQRLTDTVQQILTRRRTPQEVIEIAEAKEKAKREAEEAKKAKEAEEKAKREAKEAKKAKEAEEKAKREAEEARKAKEAEEKVNREAEEAKKAKEAEEKAQKEAEEARKAKEAEEKAKREAELAAKEKEKREAEEAAKAARPVTYCPKCGVELRPNTSFCHKCGTIVSGSAKAREAEERAKAEAKEAKEAEEKAKREAEEARKAKEAEEKARKEAEEAKKAKEAEEKAKREAEEARKAKEAEEKAKREAEEKAKAARPVTYCPKCGVELRPNTSFCHKCGTLVSGSAKAREAEEAKERVPVSVERAAEPVKAWAYLLKRRWLLVGAAVLVVLIALFIFILVALGRGG